VPITDTYPMKFVRHDHLTSELPLPNGAPSPRSQGEYIRRYMGPKPWQQGDTNDKLSDAKPEPQAFMVEVPPNGTIATHFHPVDQFQVFLNGSDGWYQRQDIPEILVHYADANTAYGPFGTRSTPLRFFTLRNASTPLTGFLPEDRDKMPTHKNKRNRHASILSEINNGVSSVNVLWSESDGVNAESVSVQLNDVVKVTHIEGSSMYCCILAGGVEIDGSTYGAEDLGWTSSAQEFSEVRATSDHALLVFLQFRSVQ
jgi:hypothetical protein